MNIIFGLFYGEVSQINVRLRSGHLFTDGETEVQKVHAVGPGAHTCQVTRLGRVTFNTTKLPLHATEKWPEMCFKNV